MQQINITELRNHLPSYLTKAHNGDEIIVTSRGHAIARIMPLPNTRTQALMQLKVLRKHCTLGDITSPIDEQWNTEK